MLSISQHKEIELQLVRYGISGSLLALLYAAAYWSLADLACIPALLANSAAFLLSLVAGWAVHSRWSFEGHGSPERPRSAYTKYLLVNLAACGLNSLWVWLIVERAGASVELSLVPILGITPWFSFWLNRRWTFS